jgi:hypothetical protein
MRFQAPLRIGCFVAIAAQAGRAQTSAPTAKKSDVVIVRGCVTGRTLVADTTTGSITPGTPLRYDLTGSKETMKALEAHSKHLEEITGTIKGGDAVGATQGVDKRWGKNRVYAGRAESNHAAAPVASGPKFEVTAFEHLSDHCGA